MLFDQVIFYGRGSTLNNGVDCLGLYIKYDIVYEN